MALSASRSHLCPLHDSNTSEAEASKLKTVKKTANLTNASQADAETEMKMQEYRVDGPMYFNSVQQPAFHLKIKATTNRKVQLNRFNLHSRTQEPTGVPDD